MPNEADLVGQNEIDELLRQAQTKTRAPTPQPAPADNMLSQSELEALLNPGGAAGSTPSIAPPPAALGQQDVEALLQQAQEALAVANSPADSTLLAGLAPFQLEDFSQSIGTGGSATLDLIREVELDLRIELGRTEMYLEDVLKLHKGSVVPLDKLAGDPVDIIVNGRPIARGEILVLNENFCVRVTELVVSETAKAG